MVVDKEGGANRGSVTVNGTSYGGVMEPTYLGIVITERNEVLEEITERIFKGNR